jgi:hypothetical protein
MLQKNQLMAELKDHASEKGNGKDPALAKLLNKNSNQDREWEDFSKHFESVNKSFYSRLKQAYPDISPMT